MASKHAMLPRRPAAAGGRGAGRSWLPPATSGKPLAAPARVTPQWVRQPDGRAEAVYFLIVSSVLLIVPTLLFGSVYLWSTDLGRRGRAWNLLRLLRRTKPRSR